MATEKNITMKQFNGTDYDTLYPKTVAAQIDDVYSKDETYPKSQLYTQSQLYTKEQILTDATKTLYGLGTGAVPDNAFQQIKTLIDNVQSSANSKARVQTGSYVGTGTYGANNPCSLTFNFAPKLVIIAGWSTGFFVYNSEIYLAINGYYSVNAGSCSQSNNTISWYSEYNDSDNKTSGIQLNAKDSTYNWVAIG